MFFLNRLRPPGLSLSSYMVSSREEPLVTCGASHASARLSTDYVQALLDGLSNGSQTLLSKAKADPRLLPYGRPHAASEGLSPDQILALFDGFSEPLRKPILAGKLALDKASPQPLESGNKDPALHVNESLSRPLCRDAVNQTLLSVEVVSKFTKALYFEADYAAKAHNSASLKEMSNEATHVDGDGPPHAHTRSTSICLQHCSNKDGLATQETALIQHEAHKDEALVTKHEANGEETSTKASFPGSKPNSSLYAYTSLSCHNSFHGMHTCILQLEPKEAFISLFTIFSHHNYTSMHALSCISYMLANYNYTFLQAKPTSHAYMICYCSFQSSQVYMSMTNHAQSPTSKFHLQAFMLDSIHNFSHNQTHGFQMHVFPTIISYHQHPLYAYHASQVFPHEMPKPQHNAESHLPNDGVLPITLYFNILFSPYIKKFTTSASVSPKGGVCHHVKEAQTKSTTNAVRHSHARLKDGVDAALSKVKMKTFIIIIYGVTITFDPG